jgi:hypothetical protein
VIFVLRAKTFTPRERTQFEFKNKEFIPSVVHLCVGVFIPLTTLKHALRSTKFNDGFNGLGCIMWLFV